jgi:hypothetical protein
MNGSHGEKILTTGDVRPGARAWLRSSHCGAASTCVEVAGAHGRVFIRDSAAGEAAAIVVTFRAWQELLAWVKARC